MAGVTRVTLFEREIRERLSQSGIEILLDRAEVLSEGQRYAPDVGRPYYSGSTMLTVDLAAVRAALREPCDAVLAERAAELLARDPRIARRVRAVAAAEAARIAGVPVTLAQSDVRVRRFGVVIHIDVDVEAELP